MQDIAIRTGLPVDRTRQVIDALATSDCVRLDHAGGVAVCGGLSVMPTPHRIRGSFGERFTCCAYDALGILAALEAGGEIDSVSPESGESIAVTLVRNQPLGASAVLFIADSSCCGSTLADWCPNVNFFEDRGAAERWSDRTGVVGRVVSLQEGTESAAREWRLLLSLAPTSSE